MSRERHARLQELFLAAADLDQAGQRAFLEEACGEDRELLSELEELLAADLLEDRSAGETDGVDVPDLVAGRGTYRIVREIGRGGAGVVYLAERADGAFQRQVAVKVLRPGRGANRELAARFRAERRILAALDHPNIARLLDGGALEDGTPFLVMELVEGEPITRYANQRRLGVRRRLELFLEVCAAVQAAHQSLVVHRDIKPSNVLVTAQGSPKLLDFGIAKLLDPAGVDWTTAETRGAPPLTPCYASPEQLSGQPVTTATDVYALGTLLFELLTGRLPFSTEDCSLRKWIVTVCESEPRRPSAAVLEAPDGSAGMPDGDRAALARRLAGDLDHIVLKALRKDPAHRYGTAAELAADIERHLAGLPVLARRGTLPYRAGKLIRRHRWPLLAVLTLVLLGTGFTAELARQLHRTRIEKVKAETVKNLLVEVFSAADPASVRSKEPTARELLDRGRQRIASGLEGEPEVKASLLEAIGQVYNNLGHVEEAASTFEQAVKLRRPGRREDPLAYAASLSGLALVRVAQARFAQAEKLQREALAVTVAKTGEEDPRAISCLDGLHLILSQAGRYREAEPMAERVVTLTLRRLGFDGIDEAVGSRSSDPALLAVATTLGSLATEQRQLGRYAAAEASFNAALALDRRLLGEEHYAVAFTLNNLANLVSNLERPQEAVTLRATALRTAGAILGQHHPAVASMHLNQGYDLIRLHRCAEARKELQQAREGFAASLGAAHPALALTSIYDGLAVTCAGRAGEALPGQLRALKSLRAGLGGEHPELARALAAVARTLSALGRHGEALKLLREAASIAERALGPDHPSTLEYRAEAAAALRDLGRPGDARELLTTVVAALSRRPDLPRQLARARDLLRAIDAGPASPKLPHHPPAPGRSGNRRPQTPPAVGAHRPSCQSPGNKGR